MMASSPVPEELQSLPQHAGNDDDDELFYGMIDQ